MSFLPLYVVMQVMFICNHCPFVIHLKKVIVKLTEFYMKVVKQITVAKVYIFLSSAAGQTCISQDPLNFFLFLSIERTCCCCYIFKFRSHTSPGDSKFISWNIATLKVLNDPPTWNSASQDGPELMAEDAKLFGYPFPYLYDEVWFSKF